MLLSIARHEFLYQARSRATLVVFTLVFGLSFLLTANSAEFVATAQGGNVFINSPYMITNTLIVLGVFSIFLAPAYMATAVLKDRDHGFDGILFSTPITERAFLGGRFLGAFLAMMLVLAAAPVGMIAGCLMPWTDPNTLGPLRVDHYMVVFFGFLTPSMLAVAALIFSTAVLTGRLLHTYVVSYALLILYLIVSETNMITPLWDPFMHRIIEEVTQYWTASERNTLMLAYNAQVTANRVLWTLLAGVFFGVAMWRFSFRTVHRPPKKKLTEPAHSNGPFGERPRVTPVWDRRTAWAQWLTRTRFEVKSSLLSLPFLVVVGLSSMLLAISLVDREILYAVDAYPLTRLMIEAIAGSTMWALLVILIFYSADIIGRERAAKCHPVLDATPLSNRIFVTSKLAAMALIMSVVLVIGVSGAVTVQMLDGNVPIEWGLYGSRLFLIFVLPFLYLAALAIFFQVLAPNRLTGMVMMGLFILVTVGMNDLLGSEHPLLKYALGGFSSPYSDMNGSGRFITASLWLRAYWGAEAGLLLLAAAALWKRGTVQPLRIRMRALKALATQPLTLSLVAVVLISGGVVFYNTNVVRTYYTSVEAMAMRVTYEQRYRQYEDLPMPTVTDVATEVDIYPSEARVDTRGSYQMKNKTAATLTEIHMVFPPNGTVSRVELDDAVQRLHDPTYNYYIFDLTTPMAPGDVRSLHFETTYQDKGFRVGNPDTRIVRNGTFINNGQLTPTIGFNPALMLEDTADRRDHGLEPLPRLPKLEDAAARFQNVNRQDSDLINFKTTVSTSMDQTAVAPGVLERTWTEDARRYFSYRMDKPMMHFYAYVSADYEVVRDQWEDVSIEIYHHAPHTYNLDRMMQSVKDSLAYFSEAFSPYQYKHLRILEFPGYRTFAQSFATTIPYSEDIGFVSSVGPDNIDLPYYVTAHEVAHQWWGHQITAANCQGSDMLYETLSQYSALLVMEQTYGPQHLRRFLTLERDLYLEGRTDDAYGELPLYRVEGQDYIHYRKGSLVMYALKDLIGEETINRALRRLLDLRAWQTEPYAASTDFLALLREEAGPEFEDVIHDFFERITLYDLKVGDVEIQQRGDGPFVVRIGVDATKFYADAQGVETEAAFDMPVDIGLFLKDPNDPSFEEKDVILLEKHRVNAGNGVVTVTVDRKPRFVGVDPFLKLIDRNGEDNLKVVE